MTFFTGTGRHRVQIAHFFRGQIGSRARSGLGLVVVSPLYRIRHRCGSLELPESFESKPWPKAAKTPRKLHGEEDRETLTTAFNYAGCLLSLRRFEETRALLRKTLPVARRVTRDSSEISIRMRTGYARALYTDTTATLDDLREAVTTLEEMERTARRVFGSAHPLVTNIEAGLREASMAFCVASMALRGA